MTGRTSWTATELMAAAFPAPKWAVPGVVAEGLTLLVGAPKVGKSWAAINLGVSVAAGGKAFGRIDVDPGPVLYLALEDTARRLQSRLGKVLAGQPAPDGLDFATACPTIADGGGDLIRSWLTRHPTARMVVIDVLARVRGKAGSDSAYEADYTPMAALKAIADQFQVAIIVVHHTRKAGSEDFLDTVSGTQGLAGAADAILVLSRTRGQADGMLSVTGRDIDEAQYALSFSSELGAWQMLDGPAEDYTLGDTRHTILNYVRDCGGGTPKQIADALGIDHATVKQTCYRMSKAEQLDTDGKGLYFPPSPVTPVTAVTHEEQSPHTPPVTQSPAWCSREGHGWHPKGCPLDVGDTGDRGDSDDGRHHVVARLISQRGWQEDAAVAAVDLAYSRLRTFRDPNTMFWRIDGDPQKYQATP